MKQAQTLEHETFHSIFQTQTEPDETNKTKKK